MRSLFVKMLLWFLGTSLLSLAAFLIASSLLTPRTVSTGFVPPLMSYHMQEARQAFEDGGAGKLSSYLNRLDHRHQRSAHYLTDASGRDLINGVDRSRLLLEARSVDWLWLPWFGHRVFALSTNDPRYQYIVVPPQRSRLPSFLPFYLWFLLGVMIFCYILAVNLARPLRRLRRTLERFGRGDLSVRTCSTRKDEIGDLSRAFDRMAERIETLLTAERRLLQDVSHELRSPLARLRFAVELARTDGDRDEALTHIQKDVERLARLVDELLQLTRAEGDPSSRDIEVVPLQDLLRSLVTDCAIEAEAKRCGLTLHTDRPLYLRGERELLRRAVENVIRNAIRYAPKGTAIEIGLDGSAAGATIGVRDYGPGVPEEALQDIFKPFFRVEGDRDRASGGVGLGLSIAQRAVSLHQGTITARNASPGLFVTIELPNPMDRPDES
jgi:two-component system sensor histidine kinase CpxA